jgi:hypothetical protein
MLRTLDVIIGLVFVFSVLSIVCSAIAEGLEAILRRRAANLEIGLRRLLAAEGSSYVDAFYRHPIIRAFYDAGGRKPSYIPPRSFALAVLDVLARSDRAKKNAVTAIDQLPDDALGNAVRALAGAVGGRVEDMVAAIERWFDDAMDRVGSAYKRGTHWILLVLGLAVAAALNADAVNIATMLATDPALRQSVVEAALNRAAAGLTSTAGPVLREPTSGTAEGEVARAGSEPQGGTAGEVAAQPIQPRGAPLPPALGPSGQRSGAEAAAAAIEHLQGLSLPIGWSGVGLSKDPRGIPETRSAWLSKVLGILVTGFALSLGAPFWFDVLNKVARLRTAVKPTRADAAGDADGTR